MDSSNIEQHPPPPQSIDPHNQNEPTFARLISTCVGIRLFVDTGVQFFNPFLPIIAAGMRVDPITLGKLVALRSLVGLISPFFGSLADRHGFRLIMRMSLIIAGVGTAIVGTSGQILTAAIGMVIWGIGLAGFAPTIQAYVSSRVPYAKRARGIGILEYSWALAGIVGLFTLGYLIEFVDGLGYEGWRAPFFVFTISMFISSVIIGRLPPENRTSSEQSFRDRQSAALSSYSSLSFASKLRHFFDLGTNARSTYATIFGTACFYAGAMQLLITHGLWLRTEYGLQAVQLGTVAFVLGFADLGGSVLVSLITDRIGKKRSVIFGIGGTLIGLLSMPFLNIGVSMALASIIFTRACFEFAVVSSIPLLSEQMPEQRGKVMTMGAAVNLTAATVASVTGPWLYVREGVVGFTSASAFLTAVALYIIWAYVKEEQIEEE